VPPTTPPDLPPSLVSAARALAANTAAWHAGQAGLDLLSDEGTAYRAEVADELADALLEEMVAAGGRNVVHHVAEFDDDDVEDDDQGDEPRGEGDTLDRYRDPADVTDAELIAAVQDRGHAPTRWITEDVVGGPDVSTGEIAVIRRKLVRLADKPDVPIARSETHGRRHAWWRAVDAAGE
jgi:hypothetical protein